MRNYLIIVLPLYYDKANAPQFSSKVVLQSRYTTCIHVTLFKGSHTISQEIISFNITIHIQISQDFETKLFDNSNSLPSQNYIS